MCIGIFKKSKPTFPPPPPILPYPEESPSYNLNCQGVDITQVLKKWEIDYRVPMSYYPFWDGVDFKCDGSLFAVDQNGNIVLIPAATVSEIKECKIRPEWANSGVVAHEFAHISYAQLNQAQKDVFAYVFGKQVIDDELLKYCYSIKPYMHTNGDLNNSIPNIVETHADCYRYLGDKMPMTLKIYYPNLF